MSRPALLAKDSKTHSELSKESSNASSGSGTPLFNHSTKVQFIIHESPDSSNSPLYHRTTSLGTQNLVKDDHLEVSENDSAKKEHGKGEKAPPSPQKKSKRTVNQSKKSRGKASLDETTEVRKKSKTRMKSPIGIDRNVHKHLVNLLESIVAKQSEEKKQEVIVRRKSCTCTWCGGVSRKEKKWDTIEIKEIEQRKESLVLEESPSLHKSRKRMQKSTESLEKRSRAAVSRTIDKLDNPNTSTSIEIYKPRLIHNKQEGSPTRTPETRVPGYRREKLPAIEKGNKKVDNRASPAAGKIMERVSAATSLEKTGVAVTKSRQLKEIIGGNKVQEEKTQQRARKGNHSFMVSSHMRVHTDEKSKSPASFAENIHAVKSSGRFVPRSPKVIKRLMETQSRASDWTDSLSFMRKPSSIVNEVTRVGDIGYSTTSVMPKENKEKALVFDPRSIKVNMPANVMSFCKNPDSSNMSFLNKESQLEDTLDKTVLTRELDQTPASNKHLLIRKAVGPPNRRLEGLLSPQKDIFSKTSFFDGFQLAKKTYNASRIKLAKKGV